MLQGRDWKIMSQKIMELKLANCNSFFSKSAFAICFEVCMDFIFEEVNKYSRRIPMKLCKPFLLISVIRYYNSELMFYYPKHP